MVSLTHGIHLHLVFMARRRFQVLKNYGSHVIKKKLYLYQKEGSRYLKKATLKHLQHIPRRPEEEISLASKEQ